CHSAPSLLSSLFCASATLFPRLNRFVGARAVKLLGGSLVAIGDSFAVLGLMLPVAPIALVFAAIDFIIDVGVPAVVYVDVSAVVVVVAPGIAPCRTHGHTRAKPHHRRSDVSGRIVVVRWICRIGPRAIPHCG